MNLPSVSTIRTVRATGSIRNDDIAPASLAIAASSASKAEGNSGSTAFTFTVTRSGNTAIAASAAWAVRGSGSHAASAADFTGNALPTGTVSFAAGQTSKTITVNVAGDTTYEATEGFTVTLSAPAANTTISTASATGSIVNDDTTATTGRLGVAGEHDWLRVSLQANRAYRFTVTGLTNLSSVMVGTAAALDKGTMAIAMFSSPYASAAPQYVWFTPTATGTYYLDISDPSTIGSYGVSAAAVSNDFTNNTTTTGTVAVGSASAAISAVSITGVRFADLGSPITGG
jgi:hypothetical protein